MNWCLLCNGPFPEDFQCFGCGGWMHYDCYWPRLANGHERDKITRAQELTRRFDGPGAPAIAAALVETLRIICPECRRD